MHILTPPPGLDCYRAGHGDESNIGCSPSPAPLIQLLARMGRKLDLSKLTDEEAKHVWEVVQRDFDLRKKEEERLEELKCKIEKEGTKRELLSNQSHLNETHCVHCLQPFKFLVNSKRQCLDCHFYTCKNCSRYNKKEQAWICDPCRLSRIVKIGSLEWYYEHVRSRFKRFGSAKVMRSLYGRLQHGQKMNPTLLGLHDRVYSLPDINSECQLRAGGGVRSDSDDEDDLVDGAEAEHYTRSFPDFPDAGEDTSRKETLIAEADLAAVFHQILQEQGQHMTPPEQEFSTEVRLTVNSRRKSLERNPKPGSPWNEQHRPQYSPDMDTSDEDVKGAQKIPVYQPHHVKRRNRASSQENINHSGNQSPAPESHTDPDVEEEELKRKLEELASNISDKGVSSEEEEEKKKDEPKPELSSSSSDPPSDAQKVSTTAGKTSRLDQTPRDLEERARHSRTTDSELSELEDKVASAAVQMQRAESEVSDIESRIAALSAAGLTVKPVEKPKKKYSTQLIMLQPPRNAGSDQGDLSTDSSEMASPNDFKVMSMPQVLRRKFNSSLEIADGDESFDRNSIYRGSLTQRNPNGKNRKADRIFAKPVMTHRP
ncbi:melanophilin isoform X8 [Chelonoidis abingdonii]|uniref:melanophilin isoform X8 n=1 Tax=Chelonoidis abingdonii TaxID=106734 RepID=UPI0013F27A0A|nr:melanophilin isoform X9 [Chelonoidis abingdonii]